MRLVLCLLLLNVLIPAGAGAQASPPSIQTHRIQPAGVDCPAAQTELATTEVKVYDEDSVAVKPTVFSRGPHKYPEKEERAGQPGAVTLQFVINQNGIPDPCSFRTLAMTNEAFEKAAFQLALGTRFNPGSVQGRPVAVRVQQTVTFEP